MALAGSLLLSLAAKTDEFERGMQRANGLVEGFGKTISALAASVLSFEGLRRGITAVVQAGDGLRQTERLFTLVKGSAEAGASSLAEVRAEAGRLGQSFEALQGAYANMTAASHGTVLQGEATDAMFKQVTASMAALGKTSVETEGVFLAFQQILSKGKITAQDFNQIAERFPGALGIAARALRITTQEFVTMREAGQLMTSDLAKITQQMQNEIGISATNGVETFAKAWERVKNATTQALEEADKWGASTFGQWIMKNYVEAGIQGWTSMGQAARSAVGVGQERTLPEVTRLQARYPGAKILTDPTAIDLQETSRERERLTNLYQQITTPRPGITPTAQEREQIKETEEELSRVNYLYQVQIETIHALGKASQVAAQQAKEGSPAIDKAQQMKDAVLLQAELQQRIEGVHSGLAALDRRAALGADYLDIQRQKTELLTKALAELQGILARTDSQALLPLLSGGNLAVPIRGISPKAWQAQVPLIQEIAAMKGVSPTMLAAIAAQESHFDPNAVSAAGATGLMQVMPANFAAYGITQPKDPRQNVMAGAQIWKEALAANPGNEARALAFYNFGAANVRARERAGQPLPLETQGFITRVQENNALLQGGTGGGQGGTLGQIQELKGQLFALGDAASMTQIEGLRDERFRPILQKIMAFRDELLPINDTIVDSVRRMINEFNVTQPADRQIGEGTRRLLMAQAAKAQDFKTFQEQAKELEPSMTAAYTGVDAEIVAAKLPYYSAETRAMRAPVLTEAQTAQRLVATEERQGILQTTEALAAQRDQLTLTSDELLRHSLAKQHASEATIEFASRLQREVEMLQTAEEGVAILENALISMATTGKLSFAQLGQSLLRFVMQVTLEASGARQKLGGLIVQGATALGGALVGTQFPDLSAQVNPDLETSGLFAGLGKASGGDVYAGGAYMVGEHGPEPFFPGVSGHIQSHEDWKAGMGSGGLSVAFNFPPGTDVESFKRSQGEVRYRVAQTLRGVGGAG